jgi:formimidoylglutamate deiminase
MDWRGESGGMNRLYRPKYLYADGKFSQDAGLLVGENGYVIDIVPDVKSIVSNAGVEVIDMPDKVLLPGLVNAHSHSFQRLIRG